MMYNKNSIHWRWALWFGKGILQGKLLKLKPQQLANRYTDGADVGGNMLTKFFTPEEFDKMFSIFKSRSVKIYDRPEVCDSLPTRRLPLGKFLPRFIKTWIAYRFGQTAWIEYEK